MVVKISCCYGDIYKYIESDIYSHIIDGGGGTAELEVVAMTPPQEFPLSCIICFFIGRF